MQGGCGRVGKIKGAVSRTYVEAELRADSTMDSVKPQPSLAIVRVRQGIVEIATRGACIVSIQLV